VSVKIFRFCFRVFSCACPTVIYSIFGKSFHFPFPYFDELFIVSEEVSGKILDTFKWEVNKMVLLKVCIQFKNICVTAL